MREEITQAEYMSGLWEDEKRVLAEYLQEIVEERTSVLMPIEVVSDWCQQIMEHGL